MLVHTLTSSSRWRPSTSAHSVLRLMTADHLLLILDKRITAALLKFQMRSSPQPLLVRLCNLTRVSPVERYHDKKHERRIEHVEEDFVAQKISCVSLNVFYHTEDASDQDEGAGKV